MPRISQQRVNSQLYGILSLVRNKNVSPSTSYSLFEEVCETPLGTVTAHAREKCAFVSVLTWFPREGYYSISSAIRGDSRSLTFIRGEPEAAGSSRRSPRSDRRKSTEFRRSLRNFLFTGQSFDLSVRECGDTEVRLRRRHVLPRDSRRLPIKRPKMAMTSRRGRLIVSNRARAHVISSQRVYTDDRERGTWI